VARRLRNTAVELEEDKEEEKNKNSKVAHYC